LEARLALLPRLVAVTEALAYAHGQRVVHRDLKPSNVLIGAFGETVVIDWGLAKELAADDDAPAAHGDERDSRDPRGGWLTVAGEMLGTPSYMSPEQARGEPIDARTDGYALGAMTDHVISGQARRAGARPAATDAAPR